MSPDFATFSARVALFLSMDNPGTAYTQAAISTAILGGVLAVAFLQRHWHLKSRQTQTGVHVLGKRVSEFCERLAASPLHQVDITITDGLNHIIEAVNTDRICWYEVAEDSVTLLHKYTAGTPDSASSPDTIPSDRMPYLAERLRLHEVVILQSVDDLPGKAHVDRQFLTSLGVQSLLLIPSSYSPRRKGVLGLASYSTEVTWPEESISQLAIAANIIGATLERMNEQNEREASEERFRHLFAQASIGIALETMDGLIIEVNPAFCSMIGYSAEELCSSTCARISHPDDEKIEQVLFQELRQGLRPNYQIEKRFFRKDGSLMWGQVSVSLLDRSDARTPLVIGMVSDITAQKNAEYSLRQRDQELQRLAGQLIKTQEEERRRISRELHDDIGQRISLLACELDLELHGDAAAQERAALLPRVRKELDAVASDIHELSHELHSASLQCCGLKVALKDLCWKYAHNHQMQIELHAETLDPKLSSDVSLCLFRVAQEAIANALKHSQTKRVCVSATQDSERVCLSVRDFGVGFDSAAQSGGIGLISMRERLRICGGMLGVKSAPDQGTEITAQIAVPVRRLAATANS
ncbi:MAG TPA: PAS domain S-box protein [Verrucomicrobiae bacterium]|nr:PAS domain S-box protein [Verrucomicrobiae bacterium]